MFAILFNAALNGFVIDVQVKNSFKRYRGKKTEEITEVPDFLFSAFFTCELFIRLAAERAYFFFAKDKFWKISCTYCVLAEVGILFSNV